MFTKILEVAAPKPMINPQEEFQKMFAFKNAIYQQANLQYQLEKKFRLIYFQYLHTGYATLEWFYPNPPIVKILGPILFFSDVYVFLLFFLFSFRTKKKYLSPTGAFTDLHIMIRKITSFTSYTLEYNKRIKFKLKNNNFIIPYLCAAQRSRFT